MVGNVRRGLAVRRRRRRVGGLLTRLRLEQSPHTREIEAGSALGEETVVADAMEAVGQDVEKEAPDELMRGKTHEAATPTAAVVPIGKCDFGVVDGHEPGIGDGGAMGVAGEIGQHALGSAERRLGVDDEGALAQRAQPLGEGAGVCEREEIAKEAEFTATEGFFQAIEKEPTERPRQRVHDNRKFGLQATHRSPSRATPPPGTRQWTCG
jgi:hypothetical protein